MASTRTLLLLALGGLGLLAASCSSNGDSTSTPPMITASGVAALPAGFALQASSLTVSSAGGQVRLGSGNAFTVSEPSGGGPATILLLSPDSKVVLLGHVDADAPAFNELSVTSTAAELLFLSTGATTLPISEWSNAYRLLAAAPETATLAGVIGARMAASPTAVGDMDPEIATAVAGATASLWHPASRAAARAPRDGIQGSAEVTVALTSSAASGAATVLSVKVDAAAAAPSPHGILVGPSLDGLGIILRNDMRIHRKYLVFRTGYVPSTGKVTDPPTQLDTWVEVANGYLPAVTGVTGIAGALIDYFSGKVAYAPVCVLGKAPPCPTLALALDPPDAKANTYQVYVVGAGGNLGLSGPPAKLAAQPAALSEVQTALADMELLEGFKELFWPILTKALPSKVSDSIWKSPDAAVGAMKQFVKEGGTATANWVVQLEKGNYLPSLADLAKALTSNTQVRDAAYNAVMELAFRQARAVDAHAVESLSAAWSSVDNILPVLKVLDQVATVGDTACIFVQIANSYDYSIWDVLAFPPVLTLVPVSATISSVDQTAPFSVTPTGYPASSLTYQWDAGAYGVFDDGFGKKANVITSVGHPLATYSLAGRTMPTVASDGINVEVFDPHGLSLGKVNGKVNFGNPWVGTWVGAQTSSRCEGACAGSPSCGMYNGPLTATITAAAGNLLNYSYVGNGGLHGAYQLTWEGTRAASLDGSVVFNMVGNSFSTPPTGCGGATFTRQ